MYINSVNLDQILEPWRLWRLSSCRDCCHLASWTNAIMVKMNQLMTSQLMRLLNSPITTRCQPAQAFDQRQLLFELIAEKRDSPNRIDDSLVLWIIRIWWMQEIITCLSRIMATDKVSGDPCKTFSLYLLKQMLKFVITVLWFVISWLVHFFSHCEIDNWDWGIACYTMSCFTGSWSWNFNIIVQQIY